MTAGKQTDRSSYIVFIACTFAFSWAMWAPLAINARTGIKIPTLPGQFFLASFGPLFGAIAANYAQGGVQGLKHWLADSFQFRVGKQMAITVVGMLITYFLAASATIFLSTGSIDSLKGLGTTEKLPGMSPAAVFVVWMITFGIGEESGWRAWLFANLSSKYTPLKAAIVVAFVWMAWHIPAFLFNENYIQMGWGIIGWIISLLYGSILLGWIFQKTKSVVPLMIWHGAFDLITASDNIPPAVPMVISMIVILQGIYLARERRWQRTA